MNLAHLTRVALVTLGMACSGQAPPDVATPGTEPAAKVTAQEAPAAAPAASPASTDAAGLKAAMDAGTVHLVDVRTPAEYAEGHAPGATNLPLQELGARMAELEPLKGEKVYLICASGARSSSAQKELVKAGFTDTVNVTGGTRGWIAAGYPVEQ